MLLGLSAVLLLVFNGRIANISGIVGRLLGGEQIASNVAFVVGLIAGPILYDEALAGCDRHLPRRGDRRRDLHGICCDE